jgi:hypothetical protein
MWGHKITRTLLPDETSSRHVARELSPIATMFDEDVRAEIDRAALALDSVWSLIGIWGGTGGYADTERFGLGLRGFGTSSCCDTGGSRDTIFGAPGPKLDLRAQLAPVVKRCAARTALTIWLETTREEIVAANVEAPGEPEDVRRCIEDGVWDLALRIPSAPWHASTTTAFAALDNTK